MNLASNNHQTLQIYLIYPDSFCDWLNNLLGHQAIHKNIYYYILYGIIAGFIHTTALYQLAKRIIDTPTHVVRLT